MTDDDAQGPDAPALQPHLDAFARTLGRNPLALARHDPPAFANPTQCFANARRQATQSGGRAVFGWMFLHRRVSRISDEAYLIAVHHAVWAPPAAKQDLARPLIDVTPFHEDPAQRPIAPGGQVLFLVDEDAHPLVARRLVGPRASRFHPIGDDPRLAAHVAGLQAAEIAACRAIYGAKVPV